VETNQTGKQANKDGYAWMKNIYNNGVNIQFKLNDRKRTMMIVTRGQNRDTRKTTGTQ